MTDRYTNCESVYQFAKELCKEKETGAYAKGYNNALHAIMSAARSEAIPAADVLEVVRCKDCKYSDSDCIVEDMLWCNNRNSPDYAVTKDFFCADGKRQEVDDG